MRRVLALATLLTAAAPVFAAGLPACCLPVTHATTAARPSCCPAKGGPCCKAPEAPKPDAVRQAPAPLALQVAPAPAAGLMLLASVPSLIVVRAARHEHRATSPDDSPPDPLALNHVLLI